MTVKESYNVAGLPTTWGFPAQKDFMPPEDALPISRVKEAGGVILGKTNVPLGLADWQSYNDIYGTTNNPFDLGRTPGGSSGGSAAALAAGYGPLSLGSDIGGSLRVPAFHCGVYAHKPTFALAPSRGHTPPPFPPLPFDRDLAVIGPMARSAADLSLLLDVIAGPDPLEAGVGYKLALPPPRHDALKDFRVLVIDTDPVLPPTGVRARIETARRQSRQGRRQRRREQPAAARFRGILAALYADADVVPRRVFPPEIYRRRAGRRGQACRPTTRALPPNGCAASCSAIATGCSPMAARARLRAQWRELFKSFDAVICPVMPTPAYPHDHSPDQEKRRISIDGRNHVYTDQLAWPGIATLPGLPATAIPIGLVAGGPADRRADRRPLAGGPHAAETRRADRARIRRLCAAADV